MISEEKYLLSEICMSYLILEMNILSDLHDNLLFKQTE